MLPAAAGRRLRCPLLLLRVFSSSSPNPDPNPNPQNHNPISNQVLGSAIKSLLAESDLDKVVSSFISYSSNPIFRSKRGLYSVVVRRLSAAGRNDAVERLLESQKNLISSSSEGFAARIISLYGRCGMPGHAAATFRQLPSLGCPRSVLSFNALLTAFSIAGDTEAIMRALVEIPNEDPSIAPNSVSFNILILAHCEKSNLDAAIDAFNLMEASGASLNMITFNTLLNGLYKVGRIDEGDKVWAKMGEKGLKPDILSYNAKLRGLANSKRIDEMQGVVEELKNAGLKPDTFTFNELIKGYADDGKLEEAERIYKELGKNKCTPNRWTFELMVPKYCEAGDFDKALKLCNTSISNKCCVGVDILQHVVDGLASRSRFEDAKKLVASAKTKSFARKRLKLPLACLAL